MRLQFRAAVEEDEPPVAGGGCAARCVGERVTSCGASCVCKLDGLDASGGTNHQVGPCVSLCERSVARSLLSATVDRNRARFRQKYRGVGCCSLAGAVSVRGRLSERRPSRMSLSLNLLFNSLLNNGKMAEILIPPAPERRKLVRLLR